jgi:hypothetical protein
MAVITMASKDFVIFKTANYFLISTFLFVLRIDLFTKKQEKHFQHFIYRTNQSHQFKISL